MGSETVINAIAKQDWLEDLSGPLQAAIRNAFRDDAGQVVKDLLHGVWLGHPLHPVLTDIPVGAWTVAMVLDALEGLSGNKGLAEGADVAVGIGLLGAVGSAVTGVTDWSESEGRGKRIGLMHGLLNAVATGLYATSYAMRKSKRRQSGVALSMLGFAISGMSAYLGGHLVFGEQLGVDHTATPNATEPQDYTAVMASAALPEGTPARVEVKGVGVLLVRRGEQIFAITETCSHLGGPLSEGKLEGNVIQCPWHGSRFHLEDGTVDRGPATFPARCFDVRVQNGQIEVRAASKQAAAIPSS
jgi:nitrite reductase/ring-hydroxylating ferredoxin subunit/uncharacterized membrane protein